MPTHAARRYIGHAVAAPGANTDIFTAVAPIHPGSFFEVTISLATSSIVDVRVTDGTTAYSQALNSAVALTAGQLYSFTFAVSRFSSVGGATALTYSIRVRTDGIIQTLIVDEVTDR